MVNSSVKIPAGCVFLNGLPVLKLVFIDLDATSIQIIHEKEFLCFWMHKVWSDSANEKQLVLILQQMTETMRK